MSASIVSGAFRTARTTILVCCVTSGTLLAAFVSERLLFQSLSETARERKDLATSTAAKILLLDERLTSSANLAVETGEKRWTIVYNSNLPTIFKEIDIATALAPPHVAEIFQSETATANKTLEKLETLSFEHLASGNSDAARSILNSEEYASNKSTLLLGTNKFLDTIVLDARRITERVSQLDRLALLALTAISVVSFLVLWITTRRRIEASEASHLAAEDRLNFMAQHDELTRLPNRGTFLKLLSSLLKSQADTDTIVAVAMLDVDHFKDINDTLGHKSGDELIRLLPERFRLGLPTDAVVARFGGDEFAVAFSAADEAEARINFEQLVLRCPDPLDVRGHMLSISVSVGVALYPDHAMNPDELLRLADLALYEAKELGRNQAHFFAPVLEDQKRLRLQLEADLRQGIETHQFTLHYQCLYSQDGEIVTGLEALLRWKHPTLGYVAPADFIPVAEQSGVIIDLGEWVLRRAFKDSARWPQLKIAINLSPMQLRDPGFLGMLQDLLTETGVNPHRFDFEITEGVLMEDNHRVRKLLVKLHELGFGISLDDFGTGYSSFSYLRTFPFDKIKIDRSYVKNIETSSRDAQIVQAMVGLGHALGLSVTAEGVETTGQHRFLADLGCHQMQGFMFARALPPEEIDVAFSGRQEMSG